MVVHCERCGSNFSAARMRHVVHCPRCLLRSDIAVPLVPGRIKRSRSEPGDQKPSETERRA